MLPNVFFLLRWVLVVLAQSGFVSNQMWDMIAGLAKVPLGTAIESSIAS